MNIPQGGIAAPQATSPQATSPQATSAHGIASDTGFAQALFAAGFSDPAASLPAQPPGNAQISIGSNRNSKNAKPQPSKEPSKDGHKSAFTVAVTSSLQATLAPPLRIQPFSRETESQSAPAETSTPAVNSAPEAHAETGMAEADRAANTDSVREASNPPTPQAVPAAPSGDLAFAARVQPAAAVTAEPGPAPRPLQHDITAPEQAKKAAEKDAADATVVQPIAAGAETSLASHGQQAYANPELASPAAAPAAAPAAPLRPVETPIPEPQAKPAAGPLKDISLQVSQPGDQKVEVRVVQQSGELHVAVRTGDSELAHGMQQGLSDLVGRLQDNGFRAEAWRPGGAAVQSGPVLETRSTSNGSQNGDSQSNSGGSHQQQGERRQNQSQRPGWVDELENTIARGEKSQGVTYGIGS